MTYRDDLQAARMRRDVLARELHQVRSRKDELDALAEKERALERELAESARDLDQARARVTLPLLQQVRVASPCKQRWDDMQGDERVRFCGGCEKNVYDLSALTASQAEALLRERGEDLCARFFRRSDGTILTSDCPVGKRKRFWRRATGATAVATALAAASLALFPAVTGTLGEVVQGMVVEPGRDEEVGRTLSPMEVRVMYAMEVERLNQAMGDAQSRLAAATSVEDRTAANQELEHLRAEAIKLKDRRKQLR